MMIGVERKGVDAGCWCEGMMCHPVINCVDYDERLYSCVNCEFCVILVNS